MRNLLPFILSIIIPGGGQIFLKDYKKGFLILLLFIAGDLVIPFIPFQYIYVVCMIWSLVDLYFTVEKIDGKQKAIRNLFFSLIIVLIIIPSIFYLLYISFSIGQVYIADKYFNSSRTETEMKEITVELDRYYDYYKRYPYDFQTFIRSKPIWSNWETDSWSNSYQYSQKDTNQYVLTSLGKDEEFGTLDDIIFKSTK